MSRPVVLGRLRQGTRRRSRQGWRAAFAVGSIVALAAYGIHLAVGGFRPGDIWSLTYGSIAAVLMLATAAYGGRRRLMKAASRIGAGTARSWLDFHIYGGALFLLMMFLHTGFRLPSGWLTGGLWTLSIWTVLSGLAGRALQTWIPKLLASGLSIDVLYERIPEMVGELRKRAVELADGSHDSVRALYERRVAPELESPRRRLIYFVDITAGIQTRLREFSYLREVLGEEDRATLGGLEDVYRAKLEIDAHYTLQQALRVWLWTHLPPSALLVALLAVHLFTVLYY